MPEEAGRHAKRRTLKQQTSESVGSQLDSLNAHCKDRANRPTALLRRGSGGAPLVTVASIACQFGMSRTVGERSGKRRIDGNFPAVYWRNQTRHRPPAPSRRNFVRQGKPSARSLQNRRSRSQKMTSKKYRSGRARNGPPANARREGLQREGLQREGLQREGRQCWRGPASEGPSVGGAQRRRGPASKWIKRGKMKNW